MFGFTFGRGESDFEDLKIDFWYVLGS